MDYAAKSATQSARFGQVAFNELTSDMGFGLGSDVGLRGLPGTLISGDNGWLSTELNWTFWQNSKNALQLVPFMGLEASKPLATQ